MLGAVHDGEDLRREIGFVTRPLTGAASVKRFHDPSPIVKPTDKSSNVDNQIDTPRQNFTDI